MASTANASEILHDFQWIRVYKDGRVERFAGTEFATPSVDSETGVRSKDVQIEPENNVSARLYLPKTVSPGRKLPLLVYFHGGGFSVESPFSPLRHAHLDALVAEANVVAVSVDYRLAPEYPLPAGYDDSWTAIKWVASQSQGDGCEEWIKNYADFDRVYFGGDSAGANIAHHMAIRVGSEKLSGLNLEGVFLDCPYFWGKDPIGDELTATKPLPKSLVDDLWLFACPSSTGLDDPLINPEKDPKLSSFGCKKLLVYVAEEDILRHRGWQYKDSLKKSGWDGEVEVVEVKGEEHCFSVCSPGSKNIIPMFKKLASFMNS